MIQKIISGGQTGADQAGLDFAIEHNIPHGGWIPKGKRTEAGELEDKYNLIEMPTKSYPKRTEKNVIESDGTAIFTHGRLKGGGLLTKKKALAHGKPFLHINLNELSTTAASTLLANFIRSSDIRCLNIAGTRASKDSQIYSNTHNILYNVYLILF